MTRLAADRSFMTASCKYLLVLLWVLLAALCGFVLWSGTEQPGGVVFVSGYAMPLSPARLWPLAAVTAAAIGFAAAAQAAAGDRIAASVVRAIAAHGRRRH